MEEKDEMEPDFNFMYERLTHYLETYAFIPLRHYNPSNLKKCDTEKFLDNEDMNIIKSIFNSLRNHYIDQVQEEIKNFMDKYNLKEKLNFKSELFFYSMMMSDLGITFEELEEINEINNLENDEMSLLKYFMNKCTEEKNIDLEAENEILRQELKFLKEQNELELI